MGLDAGLLTKKTDGIELLYFRKFYEFDSLFHDYIEEDDDTYCFVSHTKLNDLYKTLKPLYMLDKLSNRELEELENEEKTLHHFFNTEQVKLLLDACYDANLEQDNSSFYWYKMMKLYHFLSWYVESELAETDLVYYRSY